MPGKWLNVVSVPLFSPFFSFLTTFLPGENGWILLVCHFSPAGASPKIPGCCRHFWLTRLEWGGSKHLTRARGETSRPGDHHVQHAQFHKKRLHWNILKNSARGYWAPLTRVKWSEINFLVTLGTSQTGHAREMGLVQKSESLAFNFVKMFKLRVTHSIDKVAEALHNIIYLFTSAMKQRGSCRDLT